MHADLWGLVFRFALRLDLLDLACLDDLRRFTLVDRGAATAIARLAKPDMKLRVRVHRLFDFQAPNKTRLYAVLPKFAVTLPPGPLCLSLSDVSQQVARCADAVRWVSWAERRPEPESRERQREKTQARRTQRLRMIQDQLAERGLPCDPRSNSVINFVAGVTKTPDAVFKAMQLLKADRAVKDFVAARDLQCALEPHARLAQLGRLAARHAVTLPPDLHDVPRCPARLLATLWLRQAKPKSTAREDKLAVRAGRELMRKARPLPRDDRDFDLEAAIWLRAARRSTA
jgi:hypothetical protein